MAHGNTYVSVENRSRDARQRVYTVQRAPDCIALLAADYNEGRFKPCVWNRSRVQKIGSPSQGDALLFYSSRGRQLYNVILPIYPRRPDAPDVRLGDLFLGCRVSFTFPTAASRAETRMQLPFPKRRAADQLSQLAGGQVMSGRTPSPSQVRFDLRRVFGTPPFPLCVLVDRRDPSRGGRGSGETDVPDPFHPLVVWRGLGSDETEASILTSGETEPSDQSKLALSGSSSVRVPLAGALTHGMQGALRDGYHFKIEVPEAAAFGNWQRTNSATRRVEEKRRAEGAICVLRDRNCGGHGGPLKTLTTVGSGTSLDWSEKSRPPSRPTPDPPDDQEEGVGHVRLARPLTPLVGRADPREGGRVPKTLPKSNLTCEGEGVRPTPSPDRHPTSPARLPTEKADLQPCAWEKQPRTKLPRSCRWEGEGHAAAKEGGSLPNQYKPSVLRLLNHSPPIRACSVIDTRRREGPAHVYVFIDTRCEMAGSGDHQFRLGVTIRLGSLEFLVNEMPDARGGALRLVLVDNPDCPATRAGQVPCGGPAVSSAASEEAATATQAVSVVSRNSIAVSRVGRERIRQLNPSASDEAFEFAFVMRLQNPNDQEGEASAFSFGLRNASQTFSDLAQRQAWKGLERAHARVRLLRYEGILRCYSTLSAMTSLSEPGREKDLEVHIPRGWGENGAEIRLTPEQIAAKQQELEDIWLAIEIEQAQLDANIEPSARARAREVGQRIETNADGYPLFDWASQCIAAATLLSWQLPQPSTPEEHRVQNGLRTLLECTAVRQVASSAGRRRHSAGNSRSPSPVDRKRLADGSRRNAPNTDAAKVQDRLGPDRDVRHTSEARRRDKSEEPKDRVPRIRHHRREAHVEVEEDWDSNSDSDCPGRSPSPTRFAIPPRFRLPTNFSKYDGDIDPSVWLDDFQLACRAGGAFDDKVIIRNCQRVAHGVPHASECRSQNTHVSGRIPPACVLATLSLIAANFAVASFLAASAAAHQLLQMTGEQVMSGVGQEKALAARLLLLKSDRPEEDLPCLPTGRTPRGGLPIRPGGWGSGETDAPNSFSPRVVRSRLRPGKAGSSRPWALGTLGGSGETEPSDLLVAGVARVFFLGPLVHDPHSSFRPCRGVKDSCECDLDDASMERPDIPYVTGVTTLFTKRQPEPSCAWPLRTRPRGRGGPDEACGRGGQLMPYSAASCHAHTPGAPYAVGFDPMMGSAWSCDFSVRQPATPPPLYIEGRRRDRARSSPPVAQLLPPCFLFDSSSPKSSTFEMATRGSSSSAQLRPWARSTASEAALESLLTRGLLRPRTEQEEWISPPPPIIPLRFMAYHIRGFAVPAHRFAREVLHHFRVELHALGPNGVQQLANFVALCEGYLGIDLDFNLFLFFFKTALVRVQGALAPWGYCSLQAKQSRVDMFPRSELWGRPSSVRPHELAAGQGARALAVRPEPAACKKLTEHLACLAKLRSSGLTGLGIAEAFHRCRVAPLMARPRRLFEMLPTTSEAELYASLVSHAIPSEDEIRARLAVLVDSQRAASMSIPISGQPPMLPWPGTVDLSSEAPGGLRASRGVIPEEEPGGRGGRPEMQEGGDLEAHQPRGAEAREGARGAPGRGDREENPGGSSPMVLEYSGGTTPRWTPRRTVSISSHPSSWTSSHPLLWAPPAGATRMRPTSSSRPVRLSVRRPGTSSRFVGVSSLVAQESGPGSAPVKRLRRDAPPATTPDSSEPRVATEARRADPSPAVAEGPALAPALGASPSHAASAVPAAGVSYVLASSPVVGEATEPAEAMAVDAPAGATTSEGLGAGPAATAVEPLPSAGTPVEGVMVDVAAEAPSIPLSAPTTFEPFSVNPGEGEEVSRWSMEDLFGEAEALARAKAGPPTAPSALTLVSVLAPPPTAALAEASGSGGGQGAAVDPEHLVQVDPWLEALQQMHTIPATLLQMALTLRSVANPSSQVRDLLYPFVSVYCTIAFQRESIDQARRAWNAANAARDETVGSARRVSELERELASQAPAHQEELAVLRADLGRLRSDASDVRSRFQAQLNSLREERAAAILPCAEALRGRDRALNAKEEAEGACAELSQLVANLHVEVQTATGRAESLEASLSTARKSLEERDSEVEGTFSTSSRVSDGITHRTTLLSRFGMLRDAAGAVLTRLGFSLSEDIERLPEDLHRAAECCGELRAVALGMLEALEVPVSSDPTRLPAELDLAPARIGALSKQSLVRGVQEAFTLDGHRLAQRVHLGGSGRHGREAQGPCGIGNPVDGAAPGQAP
nr:unnamed protein product [Digitaria exilis]